MITWTDAALEALDEHIRTRRAEFTATGADPDEVAADIKRHVEEELSAAKTRVATREDVQRILDRLKPFGTGSGSAPAIEPALPTSAPPRPNRGRRLLWLGATCLALLILVVGWLSLQRRPSEEPAILPVDAIVQMALQGQVQPGSGRVHFHRGDTQAATITGNSIRELDNARGQKVHAFSADGRLTYDQLSVLMEHRFRETP